MSRPGSDECRGALAPITLLVTGFGKFRGVTINPTSEAVPRLRESFERVHANGSQAASRVVLPTCRVLEVAGEAVDEELFLLRESACRIAERGGPVVFLHFGVAAGAPAFALEQIGHNDASFRIPDERGAQPFRAPIDPEEPFAARHLTLLPVPALVAAVGARSGLPVVASQDPGRFICNWIYYRSLCMAEDLNARAAAVSPAAAGSSAAGVSSACGPIGIPRFASLFCHVPSFETADLDAQLRFAGVLVAEISEALHVGFDAYMARHCPRRHELPAALPAGGAGEDEEEGEDESEADGAAVGGTGLRAAALGVSVLVVSGTAGAAARAGSGSSGATGSERDDDDNDDDDDDDALYDGRPAADIAAARRARDAAGKASSSGSNGSDFEARLSAAKSGDVTALLSTAAPAAATTSGGGEPVQPMQQHALRGTSSALSTAAEAGSDPAAAAVAAAAIAAQLEALGFEPAAVAQAVADTRKPASSAAAVANASALADAQEVWLQAAADLLMARLEGGGGEPAGAGAAAPATAAPVPAAAAHAAPVAAAAAEAAQLLVPAAGREARSSSGSSGFVIAGKRESMVGLGANEHAAYASSSATAFSATALRGAGGSPVSDASGCDVSASARSASVPPPAGSDSIQTRGDAADIPAPPALPRLLSAPSASAGPPSGTPQLHLPFSIHGSPAAASAGASGPPSSVAGLALASSSSTFALPAPSAFPPTTGTGSAPLVFDLSAATFSTTTAAAPAGGAGGSAGSAAVPPAGGTGSATLPPRTPLLESAAVPPVCSGTASNAAGSAAGPALPPRTPLSVAGGPAPDLAAAFSAFVASAMQASSSSAAASSTAPAVVSLAASASPFAAMHQPHGQYKMVIVVRADLGMSAGKVAAQCCHAALKAVQGASSGGRGASAGGSAAGGGTLTAETVRAWQRQGEPIVVVKCDGLEHLETLRAAAAAVGLPAATIRDAGRTQVDPGTVTVMAVGPARREQIDEVTGGLKLL